MVETNTKSENKENEYLEQMQRIQAEFENFRKKTEKDRAEIVANANFNLISNLLPVLDNFELSLKYNKDKGVELVYKDLLKILERQGLTIVNTKGDFDANIHEALMQIDGEKDGAIVEEIQKGYLLNGRLLRASKVKIIKVNKK